MKKVAVKSITQDESPSESPIYKLNEDCLTNIFEFLSFKDRIVVERGNYEKISFSKTYILKHFCNIHVQRSFSSQMKVFCLNGP